MFHTVMSTYSKFFRNFQHIPYIVRSIWYEVSRHSLWKFTVISNFQKRIRVFPYLQRHIWFHRWKIKLQQFPLLFCCKAELESSCNSLRFGASGRQHHNSQLSVIPRESWPMLDFFLSECSCEDLSHGLLLPFLGRWRRLKARIPHHFELFFGI